ncbi:hypothetical protein [Legionella cincinnatiensis]|uniref:Uncharacterized protein n=1 Tax=Legionella cincinnatiensis TaxID=28085 RepID=A0A378IFE4_9GAMM|nr:hypothetical protein [Legionella cincinnatiensis]KTC92704.1 hypothetical protein Lcin_0614 [Legionella cincinnatiensis]STX33929.1 Uncharacterised protein [Legionella cincinnatiensis]
MRQKFEEKETKYFVNNIACERDAIYQTILDRKLYGGEITISKEYYFASHEQNRAESTKWSYIEYKSNNSRHSENQRAELSMTTTPLLDKMEPTSKEYKAVIHKMIHAVDMLLAARSNHMQYSQQLRLALRDFLSFFNNYSGKSDAYTDLSNKISIEYAIFLFDMVAFGMSEGNKTNQGNLPLLEFDFSGMKTKWDENGDSDAKAQFLNEYLSILLQQTDIFLSLWQKSHAFDDIAKHKIKNLFEEFKEVIRGFQNQEKWLNISLPKLLQNMNGFFNQSQTKARIEEQESHSFSRNCSISSSCSIL